MGRAANCAASSSALIGAKMIKSKLGKLVYGDRFRTLLTNRRGEVQAQETPGMPGVVVHFDDELFDRTVHAEVIVELMVN